MIVSQRVKIYLLTLHRRLPSAQRHRFFLCCRKNRTFHATVLTPHVLLKSIGSRESKAGHNEAQIFLLEKRWRLTVGYLTITLR